MAKETGTVQAEKPIVYRIKAITSLAARIAGVFSYQK
jgi:hypothetical protein